MKRFVLFVVLLVAVLIIFGCKDKEKAKPIVTLEKVVADLNNPKVKSTNLDVILPGIYIKADTVYNYYSGAYLGVLGFDERVSILETIDKSPKSVYIVMGNKLRDFTSYISIDDTLANGVLASTIIDVYTEVFNKETSTYLYANGTTLKSISVTHSPFKVNYVVGELLDITGLVVTGINSNGMSSVEKVTMSDITGFTSSTAGSKELTITLYGRTCTFTVNVIDAVESAVFTFLRKIDILALKQYTANITVADPNIAKVVLTANNSGGITPAILTPVDRVIAGKIITMDAVVTKVTIKTFDINGSQIGADMVITL